MSTVTLGKEAKGGQDLRSASDRSRRMFNRKVSATAKKEVPPEEVKCWSRGFSHSPKREKAVPGPTLLTVLCFLDGKCYCHSHPRVKCVVLTSVLLTGQSSKNCVSSDGSVHS